MSEMLQKLLAHPSTAVRAPGSEADFQKLATHFRAPLPSALLDFWRLSDGLDLRVHDGHILGAAELVGMAQPDSDMADWLEIFDDKGLVPLLDDHQSNYLMLAVRGPLAPRVLHVPHDDGPRVVYRTLDECFAAIVDLLNQEETAEIYFDEAVGSYGPTAPRDDADQQSAEQLLQTESKNLEWNLAVQLLDESNVDAWSRLLETNDFVRRDVLKRMELMSSPAIAELLRKDAEAFEAFTEALLDAARGAGFPVEVRRTVSHWINGRPMNLAMLFYRRNIPDAMPRLIQWLEDQRDDRDPRERPGNFFADE